jgi:hypothetical protein
MDEHEWLAQRFEANRTHLRTVAYRMLGSIGEADDAVQEAWLRLSRSGLVDCPFALIVAGGFAPPAHKAPPRSDRGVPDLIPHSRCRPSPGDPLRLSLGMRGPRRIYALGAGWLAVVTKLPFGVILGQGVLIFIPFDLIKVSLTTLVAVAVAPAIATPNAQKRGSPGRAR